MIARPSTAQLKLRPFKATLEDRARKRTLRSHSKESSPEAALLRRCTQSVAEGPHMRHGLFVQQQFARLDARIGMEPALDDGPM